MKKFTTSILGLIAAAILSHEVEAQGVTPTDSNPDQNNENSWIAPQDLLPGQRYVFSGALGFYTIQDDAQMNLNLQPGLVIYRTEEFVRNADGTPRKRRVVCYIDTDGNTKTYEYLYVINLDTPSLGADSDDYRAKDGNVYDLHVGDLINFQDYGHRDLKGSGIAYLDLYSIITKNEKVVDPSKLARQAISDVDSSSNAYLRLLQAKSGRTY